MGFQWSQPAKPYLSPISFFSTKLDHSSPKALSFSFARGKEPSRGRMLGVVPEWSKSIYGHSMSSSIMSSWYFIDSPSHVLGFHQ
jgi:hypothetical protein